MCCLGVALTLGVGQFFSVCGNYGLNCAACYTCHAREKFRRCSPSSRPLGTWTLCFFTCSSCKLSLHCCGLRRRYNLPPAFGLPPGIDDCLMHLICL